MPHPITLFPVIFILLFASSRPWLCASRCRPTVITDTTGCALVLSRWENNFRPVYGIGANPASWRIWDRSRMQTLARAPNILNTSLLNWMGLSFASACRQLKWGHHSVWPWPSMGYSAKELELNILNFVHLDIAADFHNGLNRTKVFLAFFVSLWPTVRASPSYLSTLLRYSLRSLQHFKLTFHLLQIYHFY